VLVVGAWVVVVEARARVVVVVLVVGAWVVVVDVRARVVVVVLVVGAWVVVVDVRARVVAASVVVLARSRQNSWLSGLARETLWSVRGGLTLAAEVLLRAKALTLAPEVLLARELLSTASAIATTIPPTSARRRRIGEAL
jgi:hypothetical protein